MLVLVLCTILMYPDHTIGHYYILSFQLLVMHLVSLEYLYMFSTFVIFRIDLAQQIYIRQIYIPLIAMIAEKRLEGRWSVWWDGVI